MFFLKSVLRITVLLILILFPTEVESSTLFSPSSAWETEGQIRSLNSSVPSSRSLSLCILSHFSPIWLFATLWTVAHQALLSTGFSRQEYWSEFPCPPPGDLSKPMSLAVSCIGRRVLYHQYHLGSPKQLYTAALFSLHQLTSNLTVSHKALPGLTSTHASNLPPSPSPSAPVSLTSSQFSPCSPPLPLT